MVAPPGYSLNDLIVIVKLARDVYKRCRDSPGQYQALAAETQQLSNILSDCEDIVRDKRLTPQKSQELLQHGQQIKNLLLELEGKLRKYESLGVQSRVNFDRLKWDEQAAESLRVRISTRVTMMNNFYLAVVASGQYRIQQAMDEIVRDLRSGRRRVDSVSSITTESVCREDDPAWQSIVADLEVQGIARETVQEHDDIVVKRIIEVVQEHAQARVAEPEWDPDGLSANLEMLTFSDSGIGQDDEPPRHSGERMPFVGGHTTILTPQEVHANVRLIADDWNKGHATSAVETIGYMLDRPASPECQNTQTFLRLMRGIHCCENGNQNEAFRDLCTIFLLAVDRYTLRPNIKDEHECAVLVSAAAWLGCNGLHRLRIGDALLSWTWAYLAASRYAGSSSFSWKPILDRLMRNLFALAQFMKTHGHDLGAGPPMTLLTYKAVSHDLSLAYDSYAGKNLEASELFHDRVVNRLNSFAPYRKIIRSSGTTNRYVSVALLKCTQLRLLDRWSLRYDEHFCLAGALTHVQTMLSPPLGNLSSFRKANLVKALRMDFASQQDLLSVIEEAEALTKSSQTFRRVLYQGNKLSFATHKHGCQRPGYPTSIMTTAVLEAECFWVSPTKRSSRVKSWGLIFASRYSVSRWEDTRAVQSLDDDKSSNFATDAGLKTKAAALMLAAEKQCIASRPPQKHSTARSSDDAP